MTLRRCRGEYKGLSEILSVLRIHLAANTHPLQVNPRIGFVCTLEGFSFVSGSPGIWCCQQNDMAVRASKDWLPLANDAESIHTPAMSLKNAALLALIGTILLTVLVLAHFITTILGVMHELIPAMALLTSLVHLFASLSLLVFFYVFYRNQS
jgi:hypothetical protein